MQSHQLEVEVPTRSLPQTFSLVAVMCLAIAGCSGAVPDPMDPADDGGLPAPSVTLMTRNLYVGADIDIAAIAGSPLTLPLVVADAFATMLGSRFPERASAIAREVMAVNPHVIALQEVSLVRRQSPGDVASGGTQPATDVVVDFMAELSAALATQGLAYSVASIVQNADVEVPMAVGLFGLDDVRLTDFDALLVRDDVRVISSSTGRFNAALLIAVGSDTVRLERGFATLTAEVEGQRFKFVSTHLEPFDGAIQRAQAGELIAQLATESLPVVLMGDFNSAAPSGVTYQDLVLAGYADVWLLANDAATGLTCCQAPDLRNETSQLSERLDFILLQNPVSPGEPLVQPPSVDVVGDELTDRTASGLWPSDHAGVTAEVIVKR